MLHRSWLIQSLQWPSLWPGCIFPDSSECHSIMISCVLSGALVALERSNSLVQVIWEQVKSTLWLCPNKTCSLNDLRILVSNCGDSLPLLPKELQLPTLLSTSDWDLLLSLLNWLQKAVSCVFAVFSALLKTVCWCFDSIAFNVSVNWCSFNDVFVAFS